MKLGAGTTVTVKLNNKEYQFLLVHTGGNGKEKLSLEAPLVQLLNVMAVGDTVKMWTPAVYGAKPMRVELVGVEGATE